MKNLFCSALMLAAWCLPLSVAGEEEAFTQAVVDGRPVYILPEAAAILALKLRFGAQPPKVSGYWMPTAKEADAADKAIRQFIHLATKDGAAAFPEVAKHPERYVPDAVAKGTDEVRRIDKNIQSYRVQFIGWIWDGKKQLYANYFDLQEWDIRMIDPAKRYVDVMDGGYHFWQIQYDIETKTFQNLQINGPWASDLK